jgi:predicted peptidase
MKKYITLVSEGSFMNYIVYTPEEMKKDLPMIVYLHGAGERGTAVDHLYRRAIPMLLENGLSLDAVVLCPQCPE